MQNAKFKTDREELKAAIIKTIAFFDLFDYPLAESELWRYCGVECGLEDLKSALNNGGVFGGAIELFGGFYFLAGRKKIVEIREERRNCAERKIKKAARLSKLFKLIPWIKMIAVGNMIGADNLKDESDIDLFIIAEPERIWLVRFFCAGMAKLLGQRPRKDKTRDKICLSFFISEEAMNLESLMLGGGNDIYFIYWLAGLKFVYNRAGTYEKFAEANGWIKEHLPNWRVENDIKNNLPQRTCCALFNPCRNVLNLLFNRLERKVKKLQLELLPADLKNLMNKDTRVVINDKILKLHSNDRREEYRSKWEERLLNIKF